MAKRNFVQPSLVNIFSSQDFRNPEDKYDQAFRAFLNNPDVRKYIDDLRNRSGIRPKEIKQNVEEYQEIQEQKNKAFSNFRKIAREKGISENSAEYLELERKSGFPELAREGSKHIDELRQFIDSKITIKDIRYLLKLFNKPSSWEEPLSAYILTGAIQAPSIKYRIHSKTDRILLEISPEVTSDDLRDIFRQIRARQIYLKKASRTKDPWCVYSENGRIVLEVFRHASGRNLRGAEKVINQIKRRLCGTELKNKRNSPKYYKNIIQSVAYDNYKGAEKITKEEYDWQTGRNIVIDKKIERKLELVDEFYEGAFFKPQQRKAESHMRQIYRRNKKYLS